jgi:hypothetical protein
VPETLVVERLGGISPQDFPFEAEYLFFHSWPSKGPSPRLLSASSLPSGETEEGRGVSGYRR